MYIRKTFTQKLPRFNHYFIKESPYKFLPGNVNFELVVGYAFGLKAYIEEMFVHHWGHSGASFNQKVKACFELTSIHEEVLVQKLITYLRNLEEVEIIGHSIWEKAARVATVSFHSRLKKSSDIVEHIDSSNIGIRFGDFYAKNIITGLKLEEKDGVVRVSLLHYNTKEEVQQLIDLFDEILE